MPKPESSRQSRASTRSSIIWFFISVFVSVLIYVLTKHGVSLIPYTPPPSTNPSCQSYHPETLLYCEHFQVFKVKSGEYSIVSCDSTRRFPAEMTVRFGHVYLWKISDPDSEPMKLTTGLPMNLSPLGVDVIVLDDDNIRAFVVNRAPRRRLVAIIEVEISSGISKGIDWAMGPAFPYPNAVAALSKDTALVTNDHKYTSSVFPELALSLPFADIAEINLPSEPGTQGLHVSIAKKLSVPNGIAVDRDNRRLWIASMTHGIIEYKYSIAEGAPPRTRFFEQRTFQTPFVPDNLSYRGTLVVAGHSDIIAMHALSKNETATAPSWVIELQDSPTAALATDLANIRSGPKKKPIWKTLYHDDGNAYPGTTSGALIDGGKKIALSGLFAKGILICNTPDS